MRDGPACAFKAFGSLVPNPAEKALLPPNPTPSSEVPLRLPFICGVEAGGSVSELVIFVGEVANIVERKGFAAPEVPVTCGLRPTPTVDPPL